MTSRTTLRSWGDAPRRGFTLLELLAAMALLVLLAGVSIGILDSVSGAWRMHRARLSAFEGARAGFEMLTSKLAQATLNTYWDYDDPGRPSRYFRSSELHFIAGPGGELLPQMSDVVTDAVFFVAPLGFTATPALLPLQRMLSACGFYVRFSEDPERPSFLDAQRFPPRLRYRLFQVQQPGEALAIFRGVSGGGSAPSDAWFREAADTSSYAMVDNVIGLVFRANYTDSSGAQIASRYDTRAGGTDRPPPPTFNQLPPSLTVAMVVIDEESARRLADRFGATPPPLFPSASGWLEDPRELGSDLEEWGRFLDAFQPKVEHRVFVADIAIRGAKWSSD